MTFKANQKDIIAALESLAEDHSALEVRILNLIFLNRFI